MLLLFRSGWFHFCFGILFLSGGIALVDYSRGDLGGVYANLSKSAWLNPELALWVGAGVLGHLGILTSMTLIGMLLVPKHFLRWWFCSLTRIYNNLGILRALALAVMAGLLIEPLLRFGIQPLLYLELEQTPALFVLAGLVALASWTPFTHLLALAAFAESLWFGYLYLESKNPFAPVLSHGLSEFFLVLLLWKLQKTGLTYQPPPTPEPLIQVQDY